MRSIISCVKHKYLLGDRKSMLEKFSLEAQKVIAVAESLAFDLACSYIGKEHLLLSFLKLKDSILAQELKRYDISYDLFLKEVQDHHPKAEDVFFMEYSSSLKTLFDLAIGKSKDQKEEKVSLESLAIVLLENDAGIVADFLTKQKVDKKEIMARISKVSKKKSELETIIDLHELSRGKKDPLIGRELELEQLIRALLRRNKPNALLIGEPGIGKTAIVEELAVLLSQNKIKGLENKRIYELDLSSVVGGTKYRGEFEEKLKKIIRKVKDDGNAILFIDEIHNVIKAGGAEGAIDASNILKPYLSRGDIQLIGATTIDEYHATIAKDKALSRRFQIIKIKPSTLLETKKIIKTLLPLYEAHYHIKIPRGLADYIVEMADKYLPSRTFPDKAIDILDNSCVAAKQVLNKDDIVKTIETFYGVAIDTQNRALVTKRMLQDKIFGQKIAIEKIYRWLIMVEKGFKLPKRPLSVLLFIGPSGVGKSETAKLMASSFLRNEEALIKIDMNSFQDAASLNKLVGSPPGYAGTNEKPTLLKKMLTYPNAIVLLDEIEKAHIDVLDFFLNIFDEGYFYDSHQEKIDCTNMIFIMTSDVGFAQNDSFSQFIHRDYDKKDADIYKVLSKRFKQSFLNRIDEIIAFTYLDNDAEQRLIRKYQQELNSQNNMEVAHAFDSFSIHIDDHELSKYGARLIRREVVNAVANFLENSEKEKAK